jgi:hypothetical protein
MRSSVAKDGECKCNNNGKSFNAKSAQVREGRKGKQAMAMASVEMTDCWVIA